MNYNGKALVLGGGSDQKYLVEEFNRRGFYTIIVDYYENPPAKQSAHKHYQVSTYDRDEVLKIAIKEKVDHVTTISTDQPILVAAYVCEKLGLTFHISYEQALNITNKKYMKNKMREYKIPTAKFVIIEKNDSLSSANDLNYPIIIKPVDSSGSRGVFVLYEESDLSEYYHQSLQYSQTETVIAEEFIDGQEISVDAVVVDSKVHILLITDGHKTSTETNTPLYYQNIYPSCISDQAVNMVKNICELVVEAFNIRKSPLFLQMIVDDNKPHLIEFSARIAGGSKPYFIPLVIGVDIVREYVSLLLGQKPLINPKNERGAFILNHIYGKKGVFSEFSGEKKLIDEDTMIMLLEYQLHGSKVRNASNGSDRLGAFIVKGVNYDEALCKVQRVDSLLQAQDLKGTDLMLHGIYGNNSENYYRENGL